MKRAVGTILCLLLTRSAPSQCSTAAWQSMLCLAQEFTSLKLMTHMCPTEKAGQNQRKPQMKTLASEHSRLRKRTSTRVPRERTRKAI